MCVCVCVCVRARVPVVCVCVFMVHQSVYIPALVFGLLHVNSVVCVKYFLVSQCFSLTICTRSKLPPRLTEAEQFDVIKVALDHTLAVPSALTPTSEKKGKDPAFQQVCCCCC